MKLLFILWAISLSLLAQTNLDQTSVSKTQSAIDFEKIKQERLLRIRKELVQIHNEVLDTKEKIRTSNDTVEKFKLEVNLAKLEKKEVAVRMDFIETTTNISLGLDSEKGVKKETSFADDIKAIFQPFFDGIRSISERPRKIQALKDEEAFLLKKVQNASLAVERLKRALKSNSESKLTNTYKKSIAIAKEELEKIKIKSEDVHFNLIQLEKDKGSIVTNFSKGIFGFLTTKGKNLLISIIVFAIFFWFLRLGKNKLVTTLLIRASRSSDFSDNYTWMIRPFRVIYSVFALMLALSMGILTLYALDDWVLVTLILFLIGSLVWSLRQYLPQFIEQSKIVLNLGAIREGERIIFNGIPWKIKSLGYYCKLDNPSLVGGHLRVNTRELLHHTSRPIIKNEPWFPTKINDWAILSDGTYGKITIQSAEQVMVKLIGGQVKYYSTSDYLAQGPVNLSNGFGIEIIFGIDYDHQDKTLKEILPMFKKEFSLKLETILPGMKDDFKELTLEFSAAGANSLDYRFFLRVDGKLASQKQFLERRVQSVFVEICNEQNLVIPFSQLRVHMDKDE
ncbi:MAG: hypothetical protein N4A33_10265 [Bacteriovoracaceae bacterium]|jgi:hypothetical protein|nr:hypothetical protein [Bacteriovoracaceae bacterium]